MGKFIEFYRRKNINIKYENGKAFVEKNIEKDDLNSFGSVHGGVMSTLLDIAGCFAFRSILNDDIQPVTINLNINIFKSVSKTNSKLTAVGEVIKKGTNIGLAEVVLLNEKNNIAKGSVQVYFKTLSV